ncbi:MAG: hypothetical protein QOH21_3737 [Acidobacteriota bacterium]|nr:hypothetical protein [Acidobacteriota bacterium]
MTKHDTQQLTDTERNELVFADVDDPAAWGDPVVVGPSKGPRRIRRAKHLELASIFYVLSVLHRLGADATLLDGGEIRIALESGRTLTLDVKTLTDAMAWPVSDFPSRAGHFVAFVWYPSTGSATASPNVYIVASEQLRRFVDQHGAATVSLTRLDEEVQARDAWQQLAVSTAA